MNFRNEKYQRQLLLRSLPVTSYGNFYLVGHEDRSVGITAVYPSRLALVNTYMLYHLLSESIDAMKLSMKVSILRDHPYIVITHHLLRIIIEEIDGEILFTTQRQWIGSYGTLFSSILSQTYIDKRTLLLTIKQTLDNEQQEY